MIGLDMKGAKRNFLLEAKVAPQATYAALDDGTVELSANKGPAGANHRPATPPKRKMTIIDTGKHSNLLLAQANFIKPAGESAPKWSLVVAVRNRTNSLVTYIEEHRQDIVYLLIFYVAVAVSFIERFLNYSYLSEHMDLRHVMGMA